MQCSKLPTFSQVKTSHTFACWLCSSTASKPVEKWKKRLVHKKVTFPCQAPHSLKKVLKNIKKWALHFDGSYYYRSILHLKNVISTHKCRKSEQWHYDEVSIEFLIGRTTKAPYRLSYFESLAQTVPISFDNYLMSVSLLHMRKKEKKHAFLPLMRVLIQCS